MKYGEEPIETARRELYEEIGHESPDMVALSEADVMEEKETVPRRAFTSEHKFEIVRDIERHATIKEGLQKHRIAEKELTRLFPRRIIERVLFVVPPDADVAMFNYATAKRGRYWNYPPYGVGVIASHLRAIGIDVMILNLNNEILKACKSSKGEEYFDFDEVWSGKLAEELLDFKPDIAGVTCMFTQTHISMVRICNAVKRQNPMLPVALGGVHITNCLMNKDISRQIMDELDNVDLFFLYEAEIAFTQFVKVVNKELPSGELYQVYFNSSAEKLYFADKLIPGKEALNVIPAHDLMTPTELSEYGTIGGFYCLKDKGTRMTTVLANRGCRGSCAFCSVRSFNGLGVRHRSVQSIVDELVMLRNEYAIGHIMWLDDDFLHDHKRALRLFNEIVKQNIGITWDCTNGVIAISCTDEIISAAYESGCIGLTLGVESGSPKILKQVRKPGNVKIFKKAAEVLRKYEQINSRVFLMIGFPEETYRDILDTIALALEMDLDWYNVTILQPLPNTPIFNVMVDQGLADKINFSDIRYNSGPFGKHRKMAEQNKDLLSSDFKDVFRNVDLDTMPTAEHLDIIWAYMNYHLNFKRLFKEQRSMKLMQQYKYVRNIAELVAPENAFAVYFSGYLEKKLFGEINQEVIQKMEEQLCSSKYWMRRFDDFGLSVEHMKTGIFPYNAA